MGVPEGAVTDGPVSRRDRFRRARTRTGRTWTGSDGPDSDVPSVVRARHRGPGGRAGVSMTVTFCAAGVRAAANITRAAKRACGEATEAIVYGGGLPQKIFKWPRRMHGEVRGEAAHSLPEISNCVCVCVCV